MAKKDAKRDPVEKAQLRLAEARAALDAAREHRAQVKLEGEQAIERARHRSAERLAKATMRVEQRTAAVDKAQRDLKDAQGARESGSRTGG